MLPFAGRSTPATANIVVDFPAPFGPIKQTISPSPTQKDKSRTAGTRPYRNFEILDLKQQFRLLPDRRR